MESKNINPEMRRPRGRPKKSEMRNPGGKVAKTQVYESDDDYLPTSPMGLLVAKPSTSRYPVHCRYPVRHLRRNDNQCNGSIPVNEDADAVQHQNSSHSSESSKNRAEQVTNTKTLRRSRSPDDSVNSSRMNIERLPSNFPSSAGFQTSNLPLVEVDVAQNATSGCAERTFMSRAVIEKSGGAYSSTLTEVADEINSHLSDDDYSGQLMDPSLINVEGHYVNKEVAGLFQQIIRKHTGISINCIVKSGRIRGVFVEMICSVYQKLQKTHLTDITAAELDDMFEMVNILENQKFDVTWLHERLKEISSMKHLITDYRSLKKEEIKTEKEISELEAELNQLIAKKAELNKVKETKFLMRKDCTFWGKSLVHGLL